MAPVRHRDRRVWICGVPWTVRLLAEGVPLVVDSESLKGHTSTDEALIRVSGTLAPEVRRSTLYHEVAHAQQAQVTNGHSSDEEACVQAQETGGVSVLRDPRNRWYWTYLLEGVSQVIGPRTRLAGHGQDCHEKGIGHGFTGGRCISCDAPDPRKEKR